MRRLHVIGVVAGVVLALAAPVQADQPDKFEVAEVNEGVACGGTVDIVETGFVVYHPHKKGKVLENATYHLDVIYTDGETEIFFRDRGSDLVTITDDGLLAVKVAGRTSFLDSEGPDGRAHIGNLTILIDLETWEVTTIDNGGHDVEICSHFD